MIASLKKNKKRPYYTSSKQHIFLDGVIMYTETRLDKRENFIKATLTIKTE